MRETILILLIVGFLISATCLIIINPASFFASVTGGVIAFILMTGLRR